MPKFLTLVRTVEDAAAAWELLPSLTAGLSVVSRDGLWLGPGWARSAARGGEGKAFGGEAAAPERGLEEIRGRLDEIGRRLAADDSEFERLEQERRAGTGRGRNGAKQRETLWARLVKQENQAREAASRAGEELRAFHARLSGLAKDRELAAQALQNGEKWRDRLKREGGDFLEQKKAVTEAENGREEGAAGQRLQRARTELDQV